MKVLISSLLIVTSIILTIGIFSNPTLIAFSQQSVSITPGAPDEGNLEPYAPNAINVVPGSTVSWINEDITEHTVTANDEGSSAAPPLFDSGPIPPGMAWDNMFDSPGTFGYHCVIHPWMTGRVTVG